MNKVEEYTAELDALDPAAWPAYLTERSGLPGPRGNIELGQAVADAGALATFDALIASDDEYLKFCGVVGLGAVLAAGDRAVEARLRRHAALGRRSRSAGPACCGGGDLRAAAAPNAPCRGRRG